MPVIAAQPYEYTFPAGRLALVVIDMQRDFVEEGGFGSVLGNDVRPLAAIVPTVRRLLDGFRAAKLPTFHTREGHRPDLTDCPPSKRARGRGTLTIGDKGEHRSVHSANLNGARVLQPPVGVVHLVELWSGGLLDIDDG